MVGRFPALRRILVNVALDGTLAALAATLANWLAAPGAPGLPLLAIPGAAASLLLAGLPFRLSRQHWRFAGPGEVLSAASAAVLAAGIFSLGCDAARVRLPTPAFPVLLAVCLLVLLGLPRIAYRMARETLTPPETRPLKHPVLVAGDNGDLDVFLRALANDPAAPYRAVGLLAHGQAQTGRRIQGVPVLGAVADAVHVMAHLPRNADWPELVIVTDASIGGETLAPLTEAAAAAGLLLARAPRPTAIDRMPPRPAMAIAKEPQC